MMNETIMTFYTLAILTYQFKYVSKNYDRK